MVDKKTLNSHSRLGFISQNTVSLRDSSRGHLHSDISTATTRLGKTNHRNSHIPNHLHNNNPASRRNQQNRLTKPKRNAERTRISLPTFQPSIKHYRKTDTQPLPKTTPTNLLSQHQKCPINHPPSIATLKCARVPHQNQKRKDGSQNTTVSRL